MNIISEVTNEDCMIGMARYPDNYFDLAIVDPSYGLNKSSLNGSGKLKNRVLNKINTDWDIAPNEYYFKELFRVSKNQIIWGSNYFVLPASRCIICWDKVQPWENFSQIELAWTSFDGPAQIYRYDNRTGNKIHPTQKPVALYKWLLSKYTKEGDKILDTHLGSGSSRIAAYEMGFDFTAFELDTEYFEAQEKRYKAHIAQLKLELE